MKIKAQIAMVINMDKCIGCHTCSITCKNTWTNRAGTEYMWFNNVETKPGIGYPKSWEDQERYKGGWEVKNNNLTLKAGGRIEKFAKIFSNPDMPELDDYYEPWTYEYSKLFDPKEHKQQPTARSISLLTGKKMDIHWGPNWEDDLAGPTMKNDPNFLKVQQEIKMDLENSFMAYLPRLCEHCLNPACVASCPSGAIYKRDEDGIVLVDQDACRGWRMCVSGCPYKKVYFNWKTSKAEKCIMCYPRVESGLPTVCAETCTGRLRYMGVMLYDADRVKELASTRADNDVYMAQREIFLNPHNPEIQKKARESGIHEAWIQGAIDSPIYKLAVDYGIAFPLHPEFRTLPMVWYIPTLSPFTSHFEEKNDPNNIFPSFDEMRIPIEYLANILSGGNVEVIKLALKRMTLLRQYMRSVTTNASFDVEQLKKVFITEEKMKEMYRLLAIAKFDDRFVIPTSHKEEYSNLYEKYGNVGFSCSSCDTGLLDEKFFGGGK